MPTDSPLSTDSGKEMTLDHGRDEMIAAHVRSVRAKVEKPARWSWKLDLLPSARGWAFAPIGVRGSVIGPCNLWPRRAAAFSRRGCQAIVSGRRSHTGDSARSDDVATVSCKSVRHSDECSPVARHG